MAYDAAPVSALLAPAHAVAAEGRLGVLVGAAAGGAMLGVGLAMALGHTSPIAADATIAGTAAIAGAVAARDFGRSIEAREREGAVLCAAALLALGAWVAAVALHPQAAAGYFAAAAAAAALAALRARPASASLARVFAPGAALGFAGAYAAMFALLGR